MYRMTALALVAAAAAPGCVVYPGSPGGPSTYTTTYTTTTSTVVTNIPPSVDAATARVYYDFGYDDDVWSFDAFVSDGNGIGDVVQVWADVYDDFGGPQPVESFELYPTNDPHEWFSDWLGSTTQLDPFYNHYSVDFVVYDQFDDAGYLTIRPDTE